MNEIQVVLLDIGRVLLDLDWSKVSSSVNYEIGSDLKTLPQFIGNWIEYDLCERGQISTLDFFESLKRHLKFSETLAALQNHWNQLITGPVEGIESVLVKVSGGVRLYGLSNTNEAHYQYISSTFPVLRYLERLFTSCEFGFRKPEKEIFEMVLKNLQIHPSSVLFIDDSIKNVIAAREVGMNAEQCITSSLKLNAIFLEYGVLGK